MYPSCRSWLRCQRKHTITSASAGIATKLRMTNWISPPGGCQVFCWPVVSGTKLAPPALSGFSTALHPASLLEPAGSDTEGPDGAALAVLAVFAGVLVGVCAATPAIDMTSATNAKHATRTPVIACPRRTRSPHPDTIAD